MPDTGHAAPSGEPKHLEASYEVVQQLDANTNRLLAAVAFLTLSGYTLYTFSGAGHPGDLRFPPSQVSGADVFFFLFSLGIFFALAFALTALEAGSSPWLRLGGSALPKRRSQQLMDQLRGGVKGIKVERWRITGGSIPLGDLPSYDWKHDRPSVRYYAEIAASRLLLPWGWVTLAGASAWLLVGLVLATYLLVR